MFSVANPLNPALLMAGYASGIFPMGESRSENQISWYSADPRGIIPISGFHMSANVLRRIRNESFEIKTDSAFREVIESCADRAETWINDTIIDAYVSLFELGFAHSVEVWRGGKLVGGLYGVQSGAAFFGESMFRKEPDADKIALYFCHKRLAQGGFLLWDTQIYTPHLGRFGGIAVPEKFYLRALKHAIAQKAVF